MSWIRMSNAVQRHRIWWREERLQHRYITFTLVWKKYAWMDKYENSKQFKKKKKSLHNTHIHEQKTSGGSLFGESTIFHLTQLVHHSKQNVRKHNRFSGASCRRNQNKRWMRHRCAQSPHQRQVEKKKRALDILFDSFPHRKQKLPAMLQMHNYKDSNIYMYTMHQYIIICNIIWTE